MADQLDPVVQQFLADVADYVANIQEASESAGEFAVAADEAKLAADGLRDGAIEAGEAMGHVRDEAAESAVSVKELGDQADETAAKLDLMGLSGASAFTSLGPLLGIIGALVIAAAAVAPAVAAMGLGFAAAGVFAIPTIMQITGGLTTIATDTAAVNNATTATAKNTALAKLHKDWAAIPAPIQDVITSIQGLEATWKQTAAAFQPEVLTAINEALSIARDLMTEIIPLASQGFFAINGALMQIKAAIDSSGFKQFLAMMTQMVVPATNAVMKLAMTVGGILGSALEQLAPLSIPFIALVTDIISALGGPATAALKVVIGLIVALGQAIEPLLPGLSAIATALIGDIGSSFQSFIPIITQVVQILGGSLIKILTDLEPVIANALTPNSPFMLALAQLPHLLNAIMPLINGFVSILANPAVANAAVWIVSLIVAFKGLQGALALTQAGFGWVVAVPGRIMALGTSVVSTVGTMVGQFARATAATVAWIAEHTVATAVFIAQNVAQAASATAAFIAENAATLGIVALIALLIAGIVLLATHWKQAWGDIKNWALDAWHFLDNDVIHPIMSGIAALVSWVEAHWKLLATILATVLLGPVGGLVVFLATHWKQVTADVSKVVSDVVNFFEQLPGKVMSVLASLPGKLLSFGENIIHGLINGIENAVGGLLSTVGNIAGDISGAFSSVLSILSPSRVFYQHGVNIVQGAIDGVKATAPGLLAAMRGLGTGVGAQGIGAAGAIAPATGSSSMHVTVPVTIQGSAAGAQSPQYMQGLQTAVQEAVLRYGQLNPDNGLTPAWGH